MYNDVTKRVLYINLTYVYIQRTYVHCEGESRYLYPKCLRVPVPSRAEQSFQAPCFTS